MKIFNKKICKVNEIYLTQYIVRFCVINLMFIDEFLYFEIL